MSLLTQAYVLERYGLRLNAEQIAEVMGITKAALFNQISNGQCAMKTYLDGGKRWADYRDAAEFFDAVRQAARASVLHDIGPPSSPRLQGKGVGRCSRKAKP